MIARLIFWFSWQSTNAQFVFWRVVHKGFMWCARRLLRLAELFGSLCDIASAHMEKANEDAKALQALLQHAVDEAKRR